MNLFEYIKSQLPSMPNVAIMKDMDASDELIEYIRHTTWNTNLGMLAAYGCEPESDIKDTACFTKTADNNADISGTFKGKPYTTTIVLEMDEPDVYRSEIGEIIGDFDPSEASELENKFYDITTEVLIDAINNNKCLDL